MEDYNSGRKNHTGLRARTAESSSQKKKLPKNDDGKEYIPPITYADIMNQVRAKENPPPKASNSTEFTQLQSSIIYNAIMQKAKELQTDSTKGKEHKSIQKQQEGPPIKKARTSLRPVRKALFTERVSQMPPRKSIAPRQCNKMLPLLDVDEVDKRNLVAFKRPTFMNTEKTTRNSLARKQLRNPSNATKKFGNKLEHITENSPQVFRSTSKVSQLPMIAESRESTEFLELEKFCTESESSENKNTQISEHNLLTSVRADLETFRQEFQEYRKKQEDDMNKIFNILEKLTNTSISTDKENVTPRRSTRKLSVNSKDLRKSLLKNNISLPPNNNKKPPKKSSGLFESFKSDPLLCTPRSTSILEKTPSGKNLLTQKLEAQCLMLEATPLHN